MTEETIDHYESPHQTRPTFLTVLCVFTWVFSGYTILTVPFEYFLASEVDVSSTRNDLNDMMAEIAEDDPKIAEMLEGFIRGASQMISNGIENAGWIATMGVLVAILSAFGAFLMFKLRKLGFWVYVIAKILGLISILAFLGVNIFTLAYLSFAGFIGLILIILYGVNLKHMS